MYCNACGAENQDAAKFCKKCGKEIAAPAPASSAPTAKQPPASAPASSMSVNVAKAAPSSSTIKTSLLEIRGKLVNCCGMFMAVDNIERVTTQVPKPPFPKGSLLLILLGLVLCFVIPMAFILGILCIVGGIGWICWWAYKRFTAPKGVTIHMVSGYFITIHYADHALADQVMSALGAAISQENIEISIELPSNAARDVSGSLVSKDAVSLFSA